MKDKKTKNKKKVYKKCHGLKRKPRKSKSQQLYEGFQPAII